MEAQKKIQEFVVGQLENLERETLRKIQANAYKCAAKCCDNTRASTDDTRLCVQSCMTPLQRVESVIDQHMSYFQERLQRCAMACEDNVRDLNLSQSDPEFSRKMEGSMGACMGKCADEFISKMPDTMNKIKADLNKL